MDVKQLLNAYNPWWRDPSAAGVRSKRYPVRREAAFARMLEAAVPRGGKSLVVRGPRRVGKSVLLLQLAAHLLEQKMVPPGRLLFADLSDPAFRRLGDGHELLDAITLAFGGPESEGPRVLLLDELQSVAHWDRWLKNACDWHDVRVVATGSSSLELVRGGSESGRGRWNELVLEGLGFGEWLTLAESPGTSVEAALSGRPNALEEYLESGGLPEFIRSNEPPFEQRRNLRFDLERDLKKELAGVVRDPNDTWRLYQSLALDSGNSPRAKKLAEALAIDPATVKSHIAYLEHQLLISRLMPLTHTASSKVRSVRKQLSHEHIFATEHGHIAALCAVPRPLDDDHLRGRIHETAVHTALRAAARELGALEIGYLREDGGAELDFVVALEDRAIGVEVSATTRVDKKAALARKASERFGVEVVVVSANPAEQWIDGVHCISMQTFLLDPVRALTEGTR